MRKAYEDPRETAEECYLLTRDLLNVLGRDIENLHLKTHPVRVITELIGLGVFATEHFLALSLGKSREWNAIVYELLIRLISDYVEKGHEREFLDEMFARYWLYLSVAQTGDFDTGIGRVFAELCGEGENRDLAAYGQIHFESYADFFKGMFGEHTVGDCGSCHPLEYLPRAGQPEA